MNQLLNSTQRIPLVKTTVLVLALTFFYWPNIIKLIGVWEYKPQCSHGYFILPISLWLFWVRKDALAGLKLQGSVTGLILLCGGLFFHLIGSFGHFDSLVYISMMFSLAGVLIATAGMSFFRAFFFPYFFLIFMFPIPDGIYTSLTIPLKLLASDVSGDLIKAMGIPVFQDGNIIKFTNFEMEVVEACSGMRSLVTYLMLGTLIGSFLSGSFWKKCIMVIMAIPVAFLNNILRVVVTGILGHFFSSKMAQGFFHEFTGFTTFIVGFGLMLGIYSLLSRTKFF